MVDTTWRLFRDEYTLFFIRNGSTIFEGHLCEFQEEKYLPKLANRRKISPSTHSYRFPWSAFSDSDLHGAVLYTPMIHNLTALPNRSLFINLFLSCNTMCI